MKTLNLSIWAILLFAFLLSGCKKDLPIGQDVEQVWKTGDIETREAIFFDTDYAKSLHNIPYANELHADLLARVKMRVQGASVVNIKESVHGVLAVDTIGGLGLPCWSCGEYGMSLATHTSMLYVPILSASRAPEVKGILLVNIYGPKTDFYFLERHKWIAAPQSHFALVASFFEQKIGGGIPPDTEPQFLTRACQPQWAGDVGDSEVICVCSGDFDCAGQIYGTVYNNDCYNTECVPNGGGNGNSGGNNGDDDDTGNDPNTGNNPPIIIIIQGGWIGGPPNHNDNPGGNGGIALDDSGYFDLSQINDFEDHCVASEVNYFKASHENLPNAADILIHLRNYCDFEDCLDYKNGLRGFTSCEEMPECVKAILRSANMATLANEDDLVLSAEEYDAIFGNLCRGNFSSYKKTMLINYMKNVGGFGSSTESQLNSMDFKYAVRLYQYLNAGDFSPEIVDHAVAVVGWVADLDFYVDDDQFGWLLENVEEFGEIKEFLEEFTGQVSLIDGEWFVLDGDGVLHVYIPPIDMSTSSNTKILNQIMKVLTAVSKYNCEYGYEPIDWRDYFDNIQPVYFTLNSWNGCSTVIVDFTLGQYSLHIMEPSVANHQHAGNGYTYWWVYHNTSIPALQITLSNDCLQEFEAQIYPDCN